MTLLEDGTKITFVRIEFGGNHEIRGVERAVVVAFHAFISARCWPEDGEPPVEPRNLGYCRPEWEGIRWARGHDKETERALIAAYMLERSSRDAA